MTALEEHMCRPNCFKETSGTKLGRRVLPPAVDPLEYTKYFPQRRHSDRSYAESPGLPHAFDHVERRHIKPERLPTPPGMPPLMRRFGDMTMTAKVDSTKKFPGIEQTKTGEIQLGGIRAVEGPASFTTPGLGHISFAPRPIGSVYMVKTQDGSRVQCNRSKETQLGSLQALQRRKKSDHNKNRAHVTYETPVAFPAWPGYPSSVDNNGTTIDYALKASGHGALSRSKLVKSQLISQRAATPGMTTRAQTSEIAGQSSFALKCLTSAYQNEVRHMNPKDHSIKAHGLFRAPKTRPQHLAFGFTRYD